MTVTEDKSAETAPPAPWFPCDGYIGIEWPTGSARSTKPLRGWTVRLFNADGPVMTVSELTLHADAVGLIWAEAVMFADEDGQPVYDVPHGAKLHLGEDGKPVTGTFRFLVTEMRIAAPQEIKPLKHAKRGTASNLTPKSH